MTTFPTPVCETTWQLYRRTRSARTRDLIVRDNDKLALKIAHRMSGQSPESIEDLAQIARIGLIKAVEKYDPAVGAEFSSFAVPYIQGEIQHWMRDHYGSIKIPRRAFEDKGSVERLVAKMDKLGRTIQADQAAAAIGLSQRKWAWTVEATQRKQLASIDDHQHLSAEETDDDGDQRHYARLKTLIARFPRLKRSCVQEYWFQGMSEQAIARKHKLQLAEVQRLLKEAFEQLKSQLILES